MISLFSKGLVKYDSVTADETFCKACSLLAKSRNEI